MDTFSSECATLSCWRIIGTEIFKPPPANEFGELRYFVHKARSTKWSAAGP